MNEKGIFYQSLSLAIIVHLIIALIVSHTMIWTQLADKNKKNEPLFVDVTELPKLADKTNIPRGSSRGKSGPTVPPDLEETKPTPAPVPRAVPTPAPTPRAVVPPQPAQPSRPSPPAPPAPDTGLADAGGSGESPSAELPTTRSTGGESGEGTYAESGPSVSAPSVPRRLVQPTVEDLMRYAKVDKEPDVAERENTITMDTTDLKYTSYMLGLKRRIETIWEYPETSRRAGEQGELVIRFVIGKSGKLQEAEVVKSSGYPQLDKAATKALRDASPFNPLPDSWGEDQFQITGNFIYHLYDFYVR